MINNRGYTRTPSFALRGSAGREPMRNWVCGYTLVELMVAVGLFAIVMLLASGAYLVMIGLNRQAQGIATGINNLSFALETMTRSIRTGSGYTCPGGSDSCSTDTFSFTNSGGTVIKYSLSGSSVLETSGGSVQNTLTDSSVKITSLMFYVVGANPASAGNLQQARVTMIVSGEVSSSANKAPQTFVVQTGATMRLPDIAP
ncbi:MAG: prepilin-type N-terminal cleavage/methylation domain-containing protein [Candidatus Paceibacterota bacterium]